MPLGVRKGHEVGRVDVGIDIGIIATVRDVVHTNPERPLVPEESHSAKLADKDGARRDFGLTKDEIDSLVLFLKALNGEEVDRFVAANPN